jgi:PAS domain S-box-containing protein
MHTTSFGQRPSGIPSVGELPWGSHICVFYTSEAELHEVLVPFVKAGLENNERCCWEVRSSASRDETTRVLADGLADFAEYLALAQIEIVLSEGSAESAQPDRAIERRLDEAILAGFDGLRLISHAGIDAEGRALTPGVDAIRRLNVVAAFLYPREKHGAVGLFQAVQGHRFGLVRNCGVWEILEGSEAHVARDDLERSEEKLESLFSNMSEGFAYHRIVLDRHGTPCDYVFLQVNAAFERLTGLVAQQIIGKRVTQVIPGIEADSADWIGKYGHVALTGEPVHFESYSEALDRWYWVSAFRPHKGYFAVTFTDITNRKKAEAQRQAAEERLLVTLRSIGDAVMATDTDGRVRLMNRVAEKLTGWSETEARGLPLGEVIHLVDEELGAEAENPERKVIERGATVGWAKNKVLVARDGRRIAIADNAAPVQSDTGLLGVVRVFRDVTAARAADRERELTLEFLRLVNANARMEDLIKASVAFFRERSGCSAVGLRLKAGEHYPYYETSGFPNEFLSHENDLRARDHLGNVLYDSSGNPGLECRCGNVICARVEPREVSLTEAGSFWTNDSGQPPPKAAEPGSGRTIRNYCHVAGYASVALIPLFVGGDRLGLLQFNDRRKGVFTPETIALWERLASHLAVALARCIAVEALLQSETRYRVLFENLLDGFAHCMMLYDEQGHPTDFVHLDVNEAFKKLTGFADVAGKRATELVPDFRTAAPQLFDVFARVARTGRPERIQFFFTPLALWLNVSAYSPGPGHFIALVDDITTRKRVEVEREQLVEALREADQHKNQFLATLSHELRNPLAPIKNSLHILERVAPDGDQARRAKDVIERQVEQLSRLVSDLLDVTRISRGKVQLERRRLELNDLARHVIEDHRSLFERSELDLHQRLSPIPLFVYADWNRVAQVIGNLLQNAAKFTPRGGNVQVSVSNEPAVSRAIIRVSDDGIGMAPEILARLFNPFMQAEVSLDRSKGGLGLGLALVKSLVEQHGGSVEAHSAGLGQGSEFTVRLPLDLTEVRADVRAPIVIRGVRRRVLVIEDNIDAAESLSEVLQFDEHEVALAYNGPDGIAKARTFRPDFILCDIGLPGMDGYEVARVLRADPSLKDTFLVALSGYALPEDLVRSREAGFDRHIAKPPSLNALEELLARGD